MTQGFERLNLLMIIFLIITQFSVGETLFYKIKYGPFTTGTLILSVEEPTTIQGETCYHFTSTLSYRFILFSGRDRLDSYVRVRDFTTLRSEKHILESNYSKESSCDFWYDKGVAIYSDGTQIEIEPKTKDLLTLWYYFRTLKLKRGDTLRVINHTDKKTYHLKIVVGGEKFITTPSGRFDCFIIRPEAKGSLGKMEKLSVYLSKDKNRLPVIIKTKMFLGHITAELYRICSTQ